MRPADARKRTTTLARWHKKLCVSGAVLISAVPALGGCWDSDIGKRFREEYAPGLVEGLSTALSSPGQAESGLRQMGVALADGIGAIIQPRTGSSAGSSGSSGSSSSSSSK